MPLRKKKKINPPLNPALDIEKFQRETIAFAEERLKASEPTYNRKNESRSEEIKFFCITALKKSLYLITPGNDFEQADKISSQLNHYLVFKKQQINTAEEDKLLDSLILLASDLTNTTYEFLHHRIDDVSNIEDPDRRVGQKITISNKDYQITKELDKKAGIYVCRDSSTNEELILKIKESDASRLDYKDPITFFKMESVNENQAYKTFGSRTNLDLSNFAAHKNHAYGSVTKVDGSSSLYSLTIIEKCEKTLAAICLDLKGTYEEQVTALIKGLEPINGGNVEEMICGNNAKLKGIFAKAKNDTLSKDESNEIFDALLNKLITKEQSCVVIRDEGHNLKALDMVRTVIYTTNVHGIKANLPPDAAEIQKRKDLLTGKNNNYIEEFLNGIEVLHKTGRSHKDLKPDNIMLGADGVMKLIDFGNTYKDQNAKEKEHAATIKSEVGIQLTPPISPGTNGYVNQTDTRGRSDLTKESDMYSTGSILFEMFTGRKISEVLIEGDLEEKKTDPTINTRTINHAYVGYRNYDAQTVEAELEKANAALGFVENDVADRFLEEKGLEPPKDMSKLISALLNPNKQERPDIQEVTNAYKWWKEKQNYYSATTSPTPPPSPAVIPVAAAGPDKNRADEVETIHLYIANLKAAGATETNPDAQGAKLLKEARVELAKVETPVIVRPALPVSAVASAGAASAAVGAVIDPKPAEITPKQEQLYATKLDKIKSEMNRKLFKDYDDEKIDAEEFLNAEDYPGIGVTFSKSATIRIGRDGKFYCVLPIIAVAVNGSADQAGVKADDKIWVRINNISAYNDGDLASEQARVEAVKKIRQFGIDNSKGTSIKLFDDGTNRVQIHQISTANITHQGGDLVGRIESFGFDKNREREQAKVADKAAARHSSVVIPI